MKQFENKFYFPEINKQGTLFLEEIEKPLRIKRFLNLETFNQIDILVFKIQMKKVSQSIFCNILSK